MKYRYLGKSGLLVSRVCLGTMTYGNTDWGCDENESIRITNRFIESGGNFIDTADLYTAGISEKILGKAIRSHTRSELVIATKGWFPTSTDVNARGLSRKHLFDACEASLKRMGLDYIDLYYVHGPDPFTPMEETLRALDDLVQSGKVRYIGCSNWFGWQMTKFNTLAAANNQTQFISGQFLYNLIRRDIETEILPACIDGGIGLTSWSPLASGLLTGKYQGNNQPDENTRHALMSRILVPRFWMEDALKLVDMLVELAKEREVTPAVLALSWLLRKDSVSSVIVGARSVEQIDDTLASGDWDIDDEAYTTLTDLLPHAHGYPDDWMNTALTGNLNKFEIQPEHTARIPIVDHIQSGS